MDSITNTNISRITEIKINGLFGQHDIHWKLDPHVNILAGINGSGKSTILDCMAGLAIQGKLPKIVAQKIREAKIVFDHHQSITFERVEATIKNIESRATDNPFYKELLSILKEARGDKFEQLHSVGIGVPKLNDAHVSIGDLRAQLDSWRKNIRIDIISTFDNAIPYAEKDPDSNVRTELDNEIFKLQTKYLDYQLNIGKRAYEALERQEPHEHILAIKNKHEIFLKIINNLFADTGKQIDQTQNGVVFVKGDKKLNPYDLSSGEKQILIILLTALIQDNQPSILFMDEPEISLHFDWQKKLIQYILDINPNTQIILATHSPAVILEGWQDKVVNVQDLIVTP